jgi:hypothetical protein
MSLPSERIVKMPGKPSRLLLERDQPRFSRWCPQAAVTEAITTPTTTTDRATTCLTLGR